jgi:tripartite ATP-independent transporter DctM subunit
MLGLIGMPIAFSFAIGIFVLAFAYDMSLTFAMRLSVDVLCSYAFLALPLYILMGNLVREFRIADRLIDMINPLISNIKGGLAVVSIFVQGLFGAVSGSAMSAVGSIGIIMIPEMQKKGYPRGYACAIIAAGSELALLIPPTLTAVIFGVVSQTSIAALFITAIPAAFLLASGLIIFNFFYMRKRTTLETDSENYVSFGHRAKVPLLATVKNSGVLVMPLIILGGIYGGVFTPTEAAAVAVVYMIPAALCYRLFRWRSIAEGTLAAVSTTSSIMICFFFMMMLGRILVLEQIPQHLLTFLMSIAPNKYVAFLYLNLLLLLMGMIMDDMSATILGILIIMPVAIDLGMSPYQYFVMQTINIGMGHLTPPVAPYIYLAGRIGNTPFKEYMKPTFLLIIFVYVPLTAIVTYVPIVSTFVPHWYLGIQ